MLNIGAEAGILNDKISFGLLFSNRFIPRSNIAEITGMVTFKPISMFNLSTSYTVLNGMGQSIGIGLGLNLYVANISCLRLRSFKVQPSRHTTNESQYQYTIGIERWPGQKET